MISFTNKQILDALRSAPAPIKKAFGAKDTAATIIRIKNKFSLHIDVSEMVSDEVGYLLLGLIDPQTFLKRIQEQGINGEIAKFIIDDVNQGIFIPLQEKMRHPELLVEHEYDDGDEWEDEEPVQNVNTTLNSPSSRTNTPLPPIKVEINSTSGAGNAITKNSLQTPSINLMQYHVTTQQPLASQVSPKPIDPHAYMRTMSSDIEGMQHPHPSIGSATPSRTFQTASVPFSVPHQPVPDSMYAPTRESSYVPLPPPPPPPPSAVPMPMPAPTSFSSIPKDYSTDPYREPI